QENVFIESSRSKYVEDLHTEALEGLKMMQEEGMLIENSNGVEYQDNESTVSTVTVQTDGENSTIPDTSSVISRQSSVSARSSRSGLTRQASTFRPLNSGKKSEKSKTRKRHRRTVAGIPRHVQKELGMQLILIPSGLDRVGWTVTQRLDEEQLFNGDTDNSPLTGPESPEIQGSRPQASNIIHPLSKEKVAQRFPPLSESERRPRSVAVPWMTTASSLQQKPPSPVMTMSPQAAYMSKIIPNAVLPPSIDVVEISRSRSRNSVRTVSKSSLMVSSPAPSRASSRASSSRTTSSNITSVSRYNGPTLSDTSCCSSSDSSNTLVSDSSTISSSSMQKMPYNVDTSAKHYKVNSNSSNGTFNTKVLIKGQQKDGQFVRSLSVIKSKRAPPPPSRSYSLHSKVKRRSQDLVELPIEPSVPSKKPQLLAPKTEDLKKAAATDFKDPSEEKQEQFQENKHTRLLSPSSGYSSQDGTSPQQPPSTSPKHKKGFLTKLQKLFSGPNSSSLAPAVSTQTGITEPKHDTVSVSPSVRTLRELFNIPPPPKVHAPPPPPPEVWAHSKRSFELLLGPPAPDNPIAIIKKNPKDRRQQRQSPSVSSEEGVISPAQVPPSIPPPPPYTAPLPPTIETEKGSVPPKESSASTSPVKEVHLPTDKSAPPKPETKDLPNSILIPHQSIPPPPPIEPLLKFSTDNSGTDEAPILPPSEFRNASSLKEAEEIASTQPINIPLPPPLPAQIPANSNHKYGPLSIENQHQTTACASDVHREQSNVITPSLLKMVKLRSVENNKELPTSSSSNEAPQKPIRKFVSPMTRSPPATTSSGSMNLQEAIRLRTAARSKQGPSSRLSPLSPADYLKSPSSTASFIFSKSNKKAVIETKQKQEEKENVQNNVEDSTKVTSEGESKIVGRVPPPVAKKP
uniref:Uncharacterized protein n=1 Tax=Poecilia formosa TaxID=48698 RepID=A0A087XQ86_POEFO